MKMKSSKLKRDLEAPNANFGVLRTREVLELDVLERQLSFEL
jgi:hypothetical protein